MDATFGNDDTIFYHNNLRTPTLLVVEVEVTKKEHIPSDNLALNDANPNS